MGKTQLSMSDKRKNLPCFILKKLLLKIWLLHHFPINRKGNEQTIVLFTATFKLRF